MKLIIAEKPSVGAAIAAALSVTERKNGYIEGNGYIISWCVGHLISLADASTYDTRFKKWNYQDLPIIPEDWNYALSVGKEEQFDLLESLMNRMDVSEVINACDAGREGELIFQLVYMAACCEKPISRLWISSMEDSAIKKGFENLKPGIEYEALFQSALCRAKADWLIGINATRLFSVLYHKTLNVGRVQTPTLAMLVDRSRQIAGFQKEKYHHVRLTMDDIVASTKRITDKNEAELIQETCNNLDAVCTSLQKEKKTVRPPKLYDLTTLQREANRLYGYTAKQTLEYAQNLYEQKLITYPRTDSKFLTSDMSKTAMSVIDYALSLPLFENAPTYTPNLTLIISNKDVTDHHAIIPTEASKKVDFATLHMGERALFLLICTKLLCAVGASHEYEAVTATFECAGFDFTAKGKTILDEGWKTFDRLLKASLKNQESDDATDEAESDLPEILQGKTYTCVSSSISEHFTTPPKTYTEDTLLSAMEHAGQEEMQSDAERKGLGTPATRAGIIEKLVTTGFVERKGKSLIPTQDGSNLITILPELLTSPLLTAEWEQRLSEIAKDTADPQAFIDDIETMAANLVINHSHVSDEGQQLFAPEKETIGVCPRCKKPIYEGKKNFYCGDRSCGFVLWKNDRFWTSRKKEFTKKMAVDLLKKGSIKVKGLYSEKKGTTYDANVSLDDTGKYINYKMSFEQRKGKNHVR